MLLFIIERMKTYLITFVIHNSRRSYRMKRLGIYTDQAMFFSNEERGLVKKILLSILEEFKETVQGMAINVLKDHVHLVARLQPEELSNFVRKLKGKSTHLYKKHYHITKEFHLWARKFNRRLIENTDSEIRTIHYVENNHVKHKQDKV